MTIDASRDPAPRVEGDEVADTRGVVLIDLRVVEDAQLVWAAAAEEAALALAAWFDAANGIEREEAYAIYLAALDREAAAACDLQRLSGLAIVPQARRVG